MPDLFRVFPYLASAANKAPGGAMYVPPQGGGRVDNPSIYAVLYVSDAAAGALAEAFGRFPEWTPSILQGSPSLPGSVRAIARYHLPDDSRVCDLDDPRQLLALGLRPSDVVSRDYARSRSWARRIHSQGTWIGVRWWSYYDPEWASLALWNLERLRLKDVTPLKLDDPALAQAARAIVRRITPNRK
ncbi:MAG TPA: RES domain-containing protein [Candidatus Acidoferrales bacterium]|nr:RES domain-containing protein [Candidatus Acidoferrales bacterium]